MPSIRPLNAGSPEVLATLNRNGDKPKLNEHADAPAGLGKAQVIPARLSHLGLSATLHRNWGEPKLIEHVERRLTLAA